jgi:Ca2+-binding EF-hand superfamily protein
MPLSRTPTARTAAFSKMFKLMDKDGDGTIDEAEGVAIGRQLYGHAGAGQLYWEELRKGADADGDGRVSLEEYLAYSRGATASVPADDVVRSVHQTLQELEASQSRQTVQTPRGEVPARDASGMPVAESSKSGASSPSPIAPSVSGGDASVAIHSEDADARHAIARRIFRMLDTDADGQLVLGEVLKLARSDEAEDEHAAIFSMLDGMDWETRGYLTEEEWLSMAADMPELSSGAFEGGLVAVLEAAFGLPSWPMAGRTYSRASRAEAIFREIDDVESGSITLSELSQAAHIDDEARAEFEAINAGAWGGSDGTHTLSQWTDGLLHAYEGQNDDQFELSCRRLTRHLKGPPAMAMRRARVTEVFHRLDINGDGRLSMAEFSRLINERNAQTNDSIPLFFAHLDNGGDGGDGGITHDGYLNLGEWIAGCIGSMAHFTDTQFGVMCDGMMEHLASLPGAKP